MWIDTLLPYLQIGWVRAGLILLFVLIVLRPLLFSLERLILAFTSRTKTDLDDKLVHRMYRPMAVIIMLIGLIIALQELSLSAGLHNVLRHVVYTLLLFSCAYGVLAFFDVVIVHLVNNHTASRDGTRRSLTSLLLSILRIIIALFSLLFILSIWGVEVGPYLAGLGIAGLAVALALQPTLANIFSGVGVILDRTFKEGDFIVVNDTTQGTVQRIGLRSTKLLTLDNDVIILPNSTIANAKIMNQNMPDQTVRVTSQFNLVHGADLEKARARIMSTLKKVPHVLSDPAPRVHFNAIKDYGIEILVYYTIDSHLRKQEVINATNTALYDALAKDYLRKI